MKVKDLLINYDDRLFEFLVIEFRKNNFLVQTVESKSYDDFITYSKFKDCEIRRWFIYKQNSKEKLVIDLKETEEK